VEIQKGRGRNTERKMKENRKDDEGIQKGYEGVQKDTKEYRKEDAGIQKGR
jgi:hypothetical protein